MNMDRDGSGAAYFGYVRLVVAITLTVKSTWTLIGVVRAPAEASAAAVATLPATVTVSTAVETATTPATPITTATVTAMPPNAGAFHCTAIQWDLGRLLAAAWIANLILVTPMLGFIQHGDPPSIVFDRYAYLPGALVVVPLVAACLEFLFRWQARENRHPNGITVPQTQQVPSSAAAAGQRPTDDRTSRQLLAGQRSNAAAGTCNTTTGVGTFCAAGAIESDSSDNDEEDNDSIDHIRTFSGTRIVMCVAAVALAGCVHVCGERLREWSTSHDLWTMAVRTNPDLPHAHLGLARVHRTQHRLTDATRAFESAYALAPRHASTAADALFERAEVMRDTGSRAEDVVAVMAEAVAVNPRFAKAHVGCGLIHWNTGHKDKAILSMQRALEAHPGYVAAVLNLASLHGSARNWIAAKTVLLDGIQWQLRERTGIMYEMLGDVIKAAARSASTAGNERTARHTSNSALALPSGVADEVAGAYTEALVLAADGGGDDAKLLRKLGKLYLGQRMFNEAVAFLERAVLEEKSPSTTGALLKQARAGLSHNLP
jgi:tetratricopeptide (TPR) repeat protein